MEETPNEKMRLWRNPVFNDQENQTNCLPHRRDRNCPPLRIRDDIVAIAEASDNHPPFGEPRPQSTRKANANATSRVRKTADEAREIIARNNDTIACLEVFHQETEGFVEFVLPGINTQLCDSLHARKAKRTCKDISWKAFWRAHVAAAILDINEPDWRMTLYYRLPLPKLHPAADAIIRKHEAQVVKRTVKAQLVRQCENAMRFGSDVEKFLNKRENQSAIQVHPKG
jgi:hypothetical protein